MWSVLTHTTRRIIPGLLNVNLNRQRTHFLTTQIRNIGDCKRKTHFQTFLSTTQFHIKSFLHHNVQIVLILPLDISTGDRGKHADCLC